MNAWNEVEFIFTFMDEMLERSRRWALIVFIDTTFAFNVTLISIVIVVTEYIYFNRRIRTAKSPNFISFCVEHNIESDISVLGNRDSRPSRYCDQQWRSNCVIAVYVRNSRMELRFYCIAYCVPGHEFKLFSVARRSSTVYPAHRFKAGLHEVLRYP